MFLFNGLKKIINHVDLNQTKEVSKKTYIKKDFQKNNNMKTNKDFKEFGFVSFINNYEDISVKQKTNLKKIYIDLSSLNIDIDNNFEKKIKNYYFQSISKKLIYFKKSGKNKKIINDNVEQEVDLYDIYYDKDCKEKIIDINLINLNKQNERKYEK